MKKIKRNGRFMLEPILEKIAANHRIQDDGKVAIHAFVIQEARAALMPMFSFPEAVTPHVRENLLSTAIRESLKASDLNEGGIVSRLNDAYETYYKKKEDEYTVLTSISATPPEAMRRIEFDECVITFLGAEYPENFKKLRDAVDTQHLPKKKELVHEGYCKVSIEIRDRDSYDAFARCFSALDVVRGILCMFMNSGMSITLTGPRTTAINAVHVGFLHTIHAASGPLDHGECWYEPFIDQVKPKVVNDGIARNCLWMIDRLKMVPTAWRDILQGSLIRYVKALDERQTDSAFLQIWGALEALVVNGEANSDNLPRRCAFLYGEFDYHEQILRSLRESRNMNVHRGWLPHDSETNCFLVQRYFYAVFLTHLKYADRLGSYKEMNEFLDLPPDPAKLEARAKLVNAAISFRSVPDPKSETVPNAATD